MAIPAIHSNTPSSTKLALWETPTSQSTSPAPNPERTKRNVERSSDLSERVVSGGMRSVSSSDECMRQNAIRTLRDRIQLVNSLGENPLFSPREAQILKEEARPFVLLLQAAITEISCASTWVQALGGEVFSNLGLQTMHFVGAFEKALLPPLVSKLRNQIEESEIGIRGVLQNIKRANRDSNGGETLSEQDKAVLSGTVQSLISGLETFKLETSVERLDNNAIAKVRLAYDKCKQILSELLVKIRESRTIPEVRDAVWEYQRNLRIAYGELGPLRRLRDGQQAFFENLVWEAAEDAIRTALTCVRLPGRDGR